MSPHAALLSPGDRPPHAHNLKDVCKLECKGSTFHTTRTCIQWNLINEVVPLCGQNLPTLATLLGPNTQCSSIRPSKRHDKGTRLFTVSLLYSHVSQQSPLRDKCINYVIQGYTAIVLLKHAVKIIYSSMQCCQSLYYTHLCYTCSLI